jgi:hypothetical protein
MGWLARLALDQGYAVTFYGVRQQRWWRVRPAGEPGTIALEPTAPPLEDGVRVAWVVRPEAAAGAISALASLRPRLRLVYDTLDLHHVRLARESAVTGSRGVRAQAPLMRALERLAVAKADVAVAITEEEAAALRWLTPAASIAVLPNVHLPRADAAPPLAARWGLLFMGNYAHRPNVDAVEILVHEVMPRIWASRPELELSIVGRSFPEQHFPGLDARVVLRGWVPDLEAAVDAAALLVAPLRFGAGLKGKVGFALARGLPVVTTTFGAEGFPAGAGLTVCAVGDWQTFADRTLELLESDELWSRRAAQGIEVTRRYFAPSVADRRLRRILEGPATEEP